MSFARDPRGHTVIVTGASSGIGVAFARAIANRGAGLVLVARRRERLVELAAELRAAHGTAVTVVALDLSTADAATSLQHELAAAGVTATALVNNAGFGTFGRFIDEEPGRLAQEIAVDIVAPVQLSRAFLPSIIEAQGFLVNVASMAAYTPTPRMAVYGAAKSFVLSFTEALWAETRGTGATVFALSPGATSTEFNAVVGTDDATAGAAMRTAEQVVATALSHLDARDPGPSVIDGRANRFSTLAARVLSRRAIVALMHRVTDPARRASERAATA
ncbi:SDR family NAD(P)-dependent oxidoreductase [Agromyces larvae]|uniref:SDR family NAD(P)-dependent oxidoreductase n=1 Tax=Agromyces larvae TaxID=2929802 RepID=A0ABY4BWK8_9MICO|nr:SDR family NAD(P)-dependent oxidoreductase [Agromyces larvae]UOE43610.1 SDR family NAD(P)-dependent oxidoreductase [Agromyces larvae]